MVHILARHLERLPQSGRADLEFIVAELVAELLLHEAAELRAIVNPHPVGMVYLHDDAVVGGLCHVYEEVLSLLQPFFNDCLYYAFVYHLYV